MKKRAILIVLVLCIIAGGAVFFRMAYVPPILMYHSIDDKAQITKLSVSPESFARQMGFLRRHRYNVISLERLAAYIKNGQRMPPRTIAITIDDGFYNNYTDLYPVLKKYNIPATIFVIVDKVGSAGWLGWGELKEMADSGLVTIGSHSLSHRWLTALNGNELRSELEGSKKTLEERLGRAVNLFCYPGGIYNDEVKKLVREAGYTCAVATNPGRFRRADDLYALKRVRISRTSDSLLIFRIETSGYYTWIKEHRDSD